MAKFRRIHYIWSKHDFNLSTSKEGSSSCRCTLTLIGENEETEKNVLHILTDLLSMLEDSHEDIGHFKGLDRRRICTELVSGNLMDNGIKTAEDMMLNFAKSGNPMFGKRRIEKQRKRREIHSLQR